MKEKHNTESVQYQKRTRWTKQNSFLKRSHNGFTTLLSEAKPWESTLSWVSGKQKTEIKAIASGNIVRELYSRKTFNKREKNEKNRNKKTASEN